MKNFLLMGSSACNHFGLWTGGHSALLNEKKKLMHVEAGHLQTLVSLYFPASASPLYKGMSSAVHAFQGVGQNS